MMPVLIHRGNTYKNARNQRVKVITPSKKVKNIRIKKSAKKHRCHGCNRLLLGIAALRPAAFARLPVSQRRIARPLGATHCSKCVSNKITSAFLTEEQKLVSKTN